MPGCRLHPRERTLLRNLAEEGVSIPTLAKSSHHAPSTIYRVVHPEVKRGKHKKIGRPSEINDRVRRLIWRLASNHGHSPEQIKGMLGLEISSRQVLNIIHSSGYLCHQKMRLRPKISDDNQAWRFQWSLQMLQWPEEVTEQIIFSDEKKFNLDGPDGYNYYWHDLRKEPIYFSKSQKGSKGIMFWGAIKIDDKYLTPTPAKINSTTYQEMIKGYFFPKLSEETRKIMTFQQDNATPHVSKSTLKFFADNRIPVLEWPANSPDLNPMENMWAILVRKVYANGRIYETLTELKHAIDEAWENIELETVGNLVRSFRGRVLECAIRKGEAIQGHLSL